MRAHGQVKVFLFINLLIALTWATQLYDIVSQSRIHKLDILIANVDFPIEKILPLKEKAKNTGVLHELVQNHIIKETLDLVREYMKNNEFAKLSELLQNETRKRSDEKVQKELYKMKLVIAYRLGTRSKESAQDSIEIINRGGVDLLLSLFQEYHQDFDMKYLILKTLYVLAQKPDNKIALYTQYKCILEIAWNILEKDDEPKDEKSIIYALSYIAILAGNPHIREELVQEYFPNDYSRLFKVLEKYDSADTYKVLKAGLFTLQIFTTPSIYQF